MNERATGSARQRRLLLSAGVAVSIMAANLAVYFLVVEPRRDPTPAPTPAAPPPTSLGDLAAEQKQRAVAAIRASDYATAIAALEVAQRLDPDLPEVGVLLEVARKLSAAQQDPAPAAPPPEPDPLAEATPRVAAAEAAPRTASAPARPAARAERRAPEAASRAVTPAMPAAKAPAVLLVTTEPPRLVVRVDGQVRDMTPARLELEPGRHRVELVDGQRTLFTTELRLQAGEVFALSEKLPVAQAGAPAARGLEADADLDLVALLDREAPPERAAPRPTPMKVAPAAITPAAAVAAVEQPEARAARLRVFLPDRDPGAVRRALAGALPAAEIEVLSSATQLGSSDAALASPARLRAAGLEPALVGRGPGEAWVLASFSEDLSAGKVAGTTVGVLDDLDKKEAPAFVARAVGLPSAPKLRRVSKPEDLLPLLQFQMAQFILLRARALPELEARTRQKLFTRPVEASTAEIAVAFPNGARRAEIEAGLKRLGQSELAALGIERWSGR